SDHNLYSMLFINDCSQISWIGGNHWSQKSSHGQIVASYQHHAITRSAPATSLLYQSSQLLTLMAGFHELAGVILLTT
ncbi:MAG: hypothetical protein V1253_05295, partial [Alphaproteobacteria bacterium]|nr:hypothetical protein [Alphaproteobacteria bacterium]